MTTRYTGDRARHVVDIPVPLATAVDAYASDVSQPRWQVHAAALREFFAARGIAVADTDGTS